MDQAVRTIARPQFGKPLAGEVGLFVAVMRGDPGKPDYLLFRHETLNVKAPWKDQMAWAEKLGHGYRLPTRRELHALIANDKDSFNGDVFWSNEPYGSGNAWCQGFLYGFQGWLLQSGSGIRGCAVRSVILQ